MSSSKYIANIIPKPKDNRSFMDKLASLPKEKREEILERVVKERHNGDYSKIKYDWELWRRQDQWTPDHSDWKTLMFCSGRGFGKELSCSLTVLTEKGWKTMGTLEVGDRVLDETGNWCNVTAVFEPRIPEKCYRLHFNDGSYIDTSTTHYWFTWTHQNRKQYLRSYKNKYGKSPDRFPKDWINYVEDKELVDFVFDHTVKKKKINKNKFFEVSGRVYSSALVKCINSGGHFWGTKKTTQDLLDSFYISKRQDNNHCIPTIEPVKLTEKQLPIPPEILGYWLANGCVGTENVAAHQDDIPELIAKFEMLGYQCVYSPTKNKQLFRICGIRESLQDLGVFKNKFTPKIYLEGSVEQRLNLLKGFMTGDGGVDGASCVSYTSSRESLAKDVYWLVVSLGMKAYVDQRIPKYNYKGTARQGKLNTRINFVPVEDVFFLKRKSNRLRFEGPQLLKRRHRMMVRYEEIEPHLMRCITVDSPNGAYVVGEQLLVTSNTRVGCELVRHYAETKKAMNIGIIGATAGDVTGTILNGPSGLLNVCPPWNMPQWLPSYKMLKWPNGAKAMYFSADAPERLRGPQFDLLYMDELAAWKNQEAYDMAMFGLRLGLDPKAIITTTPKPVKSFLDILARKTTYTVTGSSHENKSNIDLSIMLEQFEGTRQGRQEIEGEILMDNPSSLWKLSLIDDNRITKAKAHEVPQLRLIVVAVDPAVSTNKHSAETGICVAGYGENGHIYILECDSWKESPSEWGKRVLQMYDHFKADRIVAEVNNGGDLVISNLQTIRPLAPIYSVHASRGKQVRAEPVASIYERNKVHHVGTFGKLESQMLDFPPTDDKSLVDCVDAMVWAVTAIMELTISRNSGPYTPQVGGYRTKLVDYLNRQPY